jgi:hypothetical protein
VNEPTAVHEVDVEHVTDVNPELRALGGFGASADDHVEPVRVSIRPSVEPALSSYVPTITQAPAAEHAASGAMATAGEGAAPLGKGASRSVQAPFVMVSIRPCVAPDVSRYVPRTRHDLFDEQVMKLG